MPQEITRHRDVLAAIEGIGALEALVARHDGHYDYEIDLEVVVYGRNYHGKRVGPYVRLLEYRPGEEIVRQGDWGGNEFYFVVSGKAEVWSEEGGRSARLLEVPAGAQFGEMSVLAGSRRAATVKAPAEAPVTVLEVQRPALRLLRKLPRFSEILDTTYRRYGRAAAINDLKEVAPLDADAVRQLESISQFRILAKGHVLFHHGEPIRHLYLLKSGWARLREGSGNAVFRGPGNCLGLEGVTHDRPWDRQCTLLSRTELLEIPIARLRQHAELRETLLLAFAKSDRKPDLPRDKPSLRVARSQEALIETGLVDGTNLLVMDMELCVRCGNCSLACHRVHGHSRLLRRGIHLERPVTLSPKAPKQSLLAPAVCLHCQDPECLTGCPTGAIGRLSDGQVDIDPKTCIGCADCATQCPYNAISMIPRQQAGGQGTQTNRSWWQLFTAPLPPAVEQTDDLLAVKCNLCTGTELNPPGAGKQAYSCEENCPTGALLRVDPKSYFAEIKHIEGIVYRDARHAVARRASHADPGKRLAHGLGLILTLLVTVATGWGLKAKGLDTPVLGSWLDWRWITGLIGLAGMAGVMTYPVRKKIYRWRRGPLRYWMLAHTYLGVIGGIVLLLHGGARSGGALTTALMISFDLVILTGLLGIVIYYVAPRLLTRIEEQPLLLEDLLARREELTREIAELLASEPSLRPIVERDLLSSLHSVRSIVRQYLVKESLTQAIERVRRRYSTPESADRETFSEIVERAVTLRRVDALIYLHQSLKIWLGPHVVFTSLMLALMLVHILQVIYFETW